MPETYSAKVIMSKRFMEDAMVDMERYAIRSVINEVSKLLELDKHYVLRVTKEEVHRGIWAEPTEDESLNGDVVEYRVNLKEATVNTVTIPAILITDSMRRILALLYACGEISERNIEDCLKHYIPGAVVMENLISLEGMGLIQVSFTESDYNACFKYDLTMKGIKMFREINP